MLVPFRAEKLLREDPNSWRYVGWVSDTLCRLAIHTTGTVGAGSPSTCDVTLPADHPVAALIPHIVDIIGDLSGDSAAPGPQRWYLCRIGGARLDASMTLRENAVHDGDLVLLTTEPPPAPRCRPGDASAVVAEVANPSPSRVLRGAVTVGGITAVTVSASALAWAGGVAGTAPQLWTAAVLSGAGAAGAVVIGRSGHRMSLVLSLTAVAYAMVTGFLAEPDAPWAPALLLAASSGFAVSIMLLQMAPGDIEFLTAAAAVTGAVAAAAVIALAAHLPLATAGAILTVLSLVGLSAAPKLAVAAAGLGPSRPEIGHRRAAAGHRILTGLVTGWATSTVLGLAAITAVALVGSVPPAVAAMLAADLGLLLLLRQRTHIDVRRRVGLGAAGLCASITACIVAVSAAPEHAAWFCAAAVAIGVTAVRLATSTETPNPVVRQGLQLLEYVALVAVVPLAAWVAGVYGLVRNLSLA